MAPTLPDREAYKLIARNLAGEMGYIKEAEHHDLYLQFCAGLDISRDDLLEHTPLASTIGAASTMGYYCRNSFEEGLGAFGLARRDGGAGPPQRRQDHLRRADAPLRHRQEGAWSSGPSTSRPRRSTARTPRRRCALCGQTREQQARIRRAFRFSVLAHAAMRRATTASSIRRE